MWHYKTWMPSHGACAVPCNPAYLSHTRRSLAASLFFLRVVLFACNITCDWVNSREPYWVHSFSIHIFTQGLSLSLIHILHFPFIIFFSSQLIIECVYFVFFWPKNIYLVENEDLHGLTTWAATLLQVMTICFFPYFIFREVFIFLSLRPHKYFLVAQTLNVDIIQLRLIFYHALMANAIRVWIKSFDNHLHFHLLFLPLIPYFTIVGSC